MRLLITLLSIFLLSSCEFQEKMILEKNGSGELVFDVDASSFLKIIGEMSTADASNKKEKQTKVIDSTFVFNDFMKQYKDSIDLDQADQEKLKRFKNVEVRMQLDEAQHKMNFNIKKPFKSIVELSDFFNLFGETSKISKENKLLNNFKGIGKQTHQVTYSLRKKLFKRQVIIPDSIYHFKITDSLSKKWSFLENSAYTLTYTFPQKIKSTSLSGAIISKDRKTLSKTVPFLELTKHPELLDFEVKLAR